MPREDHDKVTLVLKALELHIRSLPEGSPTDEKPETILRKVHTIMEDQTQSVKGIILGDDRNFKDSLSLLEKYLRIWL